jgi:hypothetical protein
VSARGLLVTSLVAAALPASARAAPDADLVAALDLAGGADVVAFDLPAKAGAPRVRVATTVRAPAAAVAAVLLDPARFRAAIPALIRADVRPAAPGAPPGAPLEVAWELEVPLFNLRGRMAVRALPDGVEMALVDGDLAPGRLIFRVAERPDGRSTLEADAVADVRRTNFFIRHVMKRSAVGEPAALAAAAWVAVRATALRAEHAGDPRAWRPFAPPGPPEAWSPDASFVGDPRLGPLLGRGPLALVARAPSERLAGVAVAMPVAADPRAVLLALRDPARWRAFPGWARVDVGAPPTFDGPASAHVEDSIPFVDFDADWQGQPGLAPRWIATGGAARGARLGWQVAPARGGGAVAALALYPRLERTGRVPRGLIEAEPLLEHAMALALAFVDAWGAIGSLTGPPQKPR